MPDPERVPKPHILIVEDTDSDAELIEYELRRAGIDFTSSRVDEEAAFRAELAQRPPDIILSDYSLPRFSGLLALRLVRKLDCEAPFILVTGSQTEEVAVECMKEGASDYILKSNLMRLPSAVQNVLKRRSVELEKSEAIEALRKSEEQLRQSQKLQAIGRLAGGISHDFNNLLTAIIGYSDLTMRRLAEDNPLHRNLAEIKKAGERASALTRQLLAFSRKQVLQPRVFDLNAVVTDLERMLHPTIGEDVALKTILEANLGNVKADPGQMEQVIINLAVNARDAMPNGGKLLIETANVYLDESYARQHVSVVPGHYILLAITDSGTGIDEETKQHIFEPFFTTKEAGKGTGLGLSTVYGIIKQSGGNIWVYSEPGKGTTFKIYLPRVTEKAENYKTDMESVEAPAGTETILVVEDEQLVRDLALEVLSSLGYNLLHANNGRAALELCQEYREKIDLLLTDVVMPEISGRELANRLKALHPEMEILFMSGYTHDAIVHHGVLDEATHFMQKPFSPKGLALHVRRALDSGRGGVPGPA
ncbi:MAG TPA: response regulator [Pyrinomonadaceae bacterium]|nr:response regulator [Pyrinomonadaceae bacterium]